MCDFFFYTAPEEQNTVRIFNVAFSRDERGPSCPDDVTSNAVIKICYQDLVASHINSNFERMI